MIVHIGGTASGFRPTEYLGPKRANWGFKCGHEQQRSLPQSGALLLSHVFISGYQLTSTFKAFSAQKTLSDTSDLFEIINTYMTLKLSPESMALETCIAFLLADSYDAEDFLYFKKNTTRRKARMKLKTKQSDNLKREEEREVFNTVLQSLTISEFKSHFQLTPTQTEELVRLLAPCKRTAIREDGWTVWHAVLASLWALSTQESYHSVATRFHITESLVCDQLDEFCVLITSNLANEIHWPQGEDAETSVLGFFSTVGLPDTLCVVGTCFIPIGKPTDVPDPEAYRDAQGLYSIKPMAFCDHKGRFAHVTAEHPSNWHNSRALLATEIGKALLEDPVALLHGKHIIGDSTFPLSEHVLTPFPDYGTVGQKKVCYNQKVQSCLAVVQGSIRTLRSHFPRLRCLQTHSICQTSAAVKACCILYNMFLDTYVPVDCMEDDITQEPFHELPYGHSGSLGGISKRQDIAALLGRATKKRKLMYNN